MGYARAGNQAMQVSGRRIITRPASQIGLGIVPALVAAEIPAIGKALSSLFGGIHGEAYDSVELESIYNAALAGDRSRLAAIAAGGTTNGLPYQNSDGKNGWASSQVLSGWGKPEYANERSLAQQLLQLLNAGYSFPSPLTPSTRNSAQLQQEIQRLTSGISTSAQQASAAATAATLPGSPPASRLVMDVVQQLPAIAAPTLSLPGSASVLTQTPSGTTTTQAPAILASRRRAATAPSAGSSNFLQQIAQGIAQAIPQAAPLVNALAPASAQPVNVTVAAPASAPAGSPRRRGGTGGGVSSMLSSGTGLALAGVGIVGAVLLLRRKR